MFDALLDPSNWFTPEVLIAFSALLATTFLIRRENESRAERENPTVRASVRPGHDANGWFRCELNIRNRLDSKIQFETAYISWPPGFLLARPITSTSEIDPASASSVVKLEFNFPPAEDPQPYSDRLLFIKPPSWVGLSAIRISFKVTVQDATLRNIRFGANTNAVNWKS